MTTEQKAAFKAYVKHRKTAAAAQAEAEILKPTILEILKDAGAPIVYDGATVELGKDAEYEYPWYITQVADLTNSLREAARASGEAHKSEKPTVKFTLSKALAL